MSSTPPSPHRLPVIALLALVLAVLVAGCGSSDSGSKPTTTTKTNVGQPATADRTTSPSDDGGSAAKTTSTAAPESTDAPTTAAPKSTASPTTAAPKSTASPTTDTAVGSDTPGDAAQRLYDAWKAGDPVTAATVATPEAVQGMFATPPGDYAPYNKCDTGEFDTSGCLYRGNSGTIQFTMERKGAAWVVIEALFAEP